MELNKGMIAGIVLSFLVLACVGFSFHFYGLSEVSYDHGVLLGPTASDDLPFSKCAPSAQIKNPCVVLFTADFFAFKQDYEDVKAQLVACQKAK